MRVVVILYFVFALAFGVFLMLYGPLGWGIVYTVVGLVALLVALP